MTFAHPDWLWLLLAAPVLLLGKVWADGRASLAVDAFVARRLRDALVTGDSRARGWTVYALQMLALICFTVALCRPQWGEEKREIKESGRNVIIAIDTSRSMLATDVTPDRLTRSKLAAQDLLASLPGDRVGVIAFAGQAYLQAPLTTDHDAVLESIQALDTTSVPQGGSDITKALRIAIESVEKSPARNHGLIIFSDGGEPADAMPYYAKQAAEKKILVLAVGVGTEAGSLIPDPEPSRRGDFIRDRQGNVVQSRLDSAILQQIVKTTGGRYLKLGAQPITHTLVNEILAALDRQQDTTKEERKPIERFRWPLSLGIFFLMLAWLARPTHHARRLTPAVALIICSALAPQQASAAGSSVFDSLFGSVFQRPEVEASAEARRAYEGGLFEKARDLYARVLADDPPAAEKAELEYGLGATAHQLKDYDRAVDAFSVALEARDSGLQTRAHRGLAHALYDQGDRTLAKQPQFTIRAWTDAIRHFDAALALKDDAEARENRDFVKKRLEELKQQEEQKKQQQKKKGGKKDGQQGGQGKEGDESEEEGEKGQKGKNGKEQGKEEKDGSQGDEEGQKDEGGKGEESGKEGQGKEQLPEGQIAAGQGGEKPEDKDTQQDPREMAEAERNETTGFSRNEARALLRTYADDQKAAQFRKSRREPINGKDW